MDGNHMTAMTRLEQIALFTRIWHHVCNGEMKINHAGVFGTAHRGYTLAVTDIKHACSVAPMPLDITADLSCNKPAVPIASQPIASQPLTWTAQMPTQPAGSGVTWGFVDISGTGPDSLPVPVENKCECGLDATRAGGIHQHYCPKGTK